MPKRKISVEEKRTSLRKRAPILKNKAALKSITQLVTKRPEVIQEVITVLVNLEHWHQESGGVVAAAKRRSNENSVSSRSSSSSAVSDSATDASKSSPHKCDANWLSDGYTRRSLVSWSLLPCADSSSKISTGAANAKIQSRTSSLQCDRRVPLPRCKRELQERTHGETGERRR